MKKILLFLTMSFVVFSFNGFAQFKVISNGNVGISTTIPAYKLDVQSMESRSFYPGRNALHINHFGMDPRLCSKDRIVFYKLNGSGYAKIEYQASLQASDQETMENIVPLENKGIATISKLRGLSFNSKNDTAKRTEIGFLAQEVDTVIPEAVFTNDSTKRMSLAYNSIIPYLVEAIKEQQKQIKALLVRFEWLEVELKKDNIIDSTLPGLLKNSAKSADAWMEQNTPNPFNRETRINCFIPDYAKSSFLYCYNVNGTQSQTYRVTGTGNQEVTILGNSFIPGVYFYSLVIDDKIVDTRKMILTK